jgi:serine protease Do
MLATLPERAAPARRPLPGLKRAGAAFAAITFIALAPAAEARAPDSFADLAAKVTPAVVNIATVGTQTKGGDEAFESMVPNVPKDSPFYDLFRRFERRMEPRTERTRALGSGFIIDPSGYVVTNNHVIDGAQKVTVTLQDGRKFEAKTVGRDPKTDVALLKIESSEKLPAVEFGDSDKARVGDWVMAVGNPFGLGGTVTAGIVSARNRNIHSGPYDDYLQIDAPINKGNSGGPLFDMDGKVVGINTAIYSPNGGSIGIGFAVPASVARPVIEQLRAHGKVERGWLGVGVQPVTKVIADSFGLDRARGGLVSQVMPDSPAARSGLRLGDVILSVNGKAVEQSRDLPPLIAALKEGERAELVIWRDKKEHTIAVTIASQPSDDAAAKSAPGLDEKGMYGVALAPLTPPARAAFDIPRQVEGVLIARVVAGSPAAENGLAAGDVIQRIGNEKVRDPSAAIKLLDAAKRDGKAVLVLVSRKGETRFVVLKAGEV